MLKGNGEALRGDGKALIYNEEESKADTYRCIKGDEPMLKCKVGALKDDK